MNLVIVGGGITALAAAQRAVELARERDIIYISRVVEARRRLGGTIATERTDGFLVEAGPDSLLSDKPWALDLCRRLGVEDRLARTDDRYRRVFVWFRGRLCPARRFSAARAVRGLVLVLVARQGPHGARSRPSSWRRRGRRRG